MRSTLSTGSGGYELVRHDQVRLRFDSAGKLTSIKDQNDQGLTLTYAADRQAPERDRSVGYAFTSGRLTSVTDVAGE